MKYGAEMSSGAMIYVPSFIKIRSNIQTLISGEGIRRNKDSMDIACLLLSFENKYGKMCQYDKPSSEDGSKTQSRNMLIH
jgi:hypothetical protein